jgi:hypothetical protein
MNVDGVSHRLAVHPRVFLKGKNLPADDCQTPDVVTGKLIEDGPLRLIRNRKHDPGRHTPGKGRLG